MNTLKTLTLAALLAAGTILATEAQASFIKDDLGFQSETVEWVPHPDPPGASGDVPPGPYAAADWPPGPYAAADYPPGPT